MTEPERQCISCKKRLPKKNLLKIVRLPSGSIEIDRQQKKNGRSAYLCWDVTCVEKAKSDALLSCALGCTIPSLIYLDLLKMINRKESSSIQKMMGFAHRAGKLLLGKTAVENGLKNGKVKLIVLDNTAGKTTREGIQGKCIASDLPIIVLNDSDSLGKLLGKANCKCAGIIDSHFAKQIVINDKITENQN